MMIKATDAPSPFRRDRSYSSVKVIYFPTVQSNLKADGRRACPPVFGNLRAPRSRVKLHNEDYVRSRVLDRRVTSGCWFSPFNLIQLLAKRFPLNRQSPAKPGCDLDLNLGHDCYHLLSCGGRVDRSNGTRHIHNSCQTTENPIKPCQPRLEHSQISRATAPMTLRITLTLLVSNICLKQTFERVTLFAEFSEFPKKRWKRRADPSMGHRAGPFPPLHAACPSVPRLHPTSDCQIDRLAQVSIMPAHRPGQTGKQSLPRGTE